MSPQDDAKDFARDIALEAANGFQPGMEINDDGQIGKALHGAEWSRKRMSASPPRTVRAVVNGGVKVVHWAEQNQAS